MELTNINSNRHHVTSTPASVKTEANRQPMTPPVRPDERGNIQKSFNALSAIASVETLEDADIAANLDGSDVQLAAPAKKRSYEEYCRLINGNVHKMLSEQLKRNDYLKEAVARISGAIASFNQNIKDKLDALLKELDSAVTELEAAQGELGTIEGQAQHIKTRIEGLQAKLSQLDPGSAEYQLVSAELQGEENALLKLETPLKQALQNVEQKAALANGVQSQINNIITSTLNNSQSRTMLDMSIVEESSSEQLRMSHRIIYILQQSIKDRAEEATRRAEEELKRTEFNVEVMGKQRVQQARNAEREYEKSQEAAKKSDCISKWVGVLVSAVSIVVTVATGGLASPLAVVLIGLTVADMATSLATGKSFIGKALEPIMNSVLMPILEALGKAVDWLFKHSPLGALLKEILPADVYESLRSGIQIVGTLLAVIAAAYLLKNAASAVGKLDVTKAITEAVMKQLHTLMEAVSRNIPAVMKNMGRSVGESMKTVSSKLTASENVAKYAPVAEAANEGVRAGNVIQGQIAQVNVAKTNKASTDARINVEMLEGIREKQDELSEMMQESFKALQEQIEKLSRMLLMVIQQNTQLGHKILMPIKAG